MCSRGIVGVKLVTKDGIQYLHIDDLDKLNPHEFADHINSLQEKYPDLNLQPIVKRILIITGVFDRKYETKMVSGNILEITESIPDLKMTYDHCSAMKEVLKDVSDSKIRSIYNEIIPNIGDMLYEKLFDAAFDGQEFNFKSDLRDISVDIKALEKFDNEILSKAVKCFYLLIQIFLDFPDIDNLTDLSNISFKFSSQRCMFKFCETLHKEFKPLVESPHVESYREIFNILTNSGLFDVLEKAFDIKIIQQYDQQNLSSLLGLI